MESCRLPGVQGEKARIILASASPRRRELLEMLGIRDFIVSPALGEESICGGLGPRETVIGLALEKAREVSRRFGPEDIIIGADTVVRLGGETLGKPKSGDEAAEMLRMLSGAAHTVYTGVAVMRGGLTLTDASATRVFFRRITEREIDAYIASGEPMDKAGAYGAQGLASLFVERLDGDFFNVMGLPLCLLGKMLSEAGYCVL